MKKIISTAFLVAGCSVYLSGCSLSPAKARELTVLGLCKVLVTNKYTDEAKETAMAEITNRGENCNKWMPTINADIAREQAVGNALLQQNSIKRPSQCSSYMIGNYLQTNCY